MSYRQAAILAALFFFVYYFVFAAPQHKRLGSPTLTQHRSISLRRFLAKTQPRPLQESTIPPTLRPRSVSGMWHRKSFPIVWFMRKYANPVSPGLSPTVKFNSRASTAVGDRFAPKFPEDKLKFQLANNISPGHTGNTLTTK